MQNCDLIVSAAYCLPVAPNNQVFEDYALAVHQGVILEVGPRQQIEAAFQPAGSLDLSRHILMPGLINTHGHAAMTLLRGAGEDQALQAWLTDTIWPLEGRLMNSEFVGLGTELAIAEMVRSGTTTFSDMYFFPEVVAKTAAELGVRVQIAFPVIEMPNAWSTSVEEGFHKGLALHDEYRHHSRVNVAFGPHAAYTVSAENLTKVGTYANELDTNVQIHLHENAAEVADAFARQGKSWIDHVHEVGLLGPNLQAAHVTQVTEAELDLIAACGAKVLHCPSSNMKLASGTCPVGRFHQAGVCVGLGTDGAASNNRLDLFKEVHLAALLAKHSSADPTQGAAADMVRMATLDGARALGIDHLTGSLQANKSADFISINLDHVGMLPLYDPFATVVHGNCGDAVDHVYVAGEPLLHDKTFTRIDAAELAGRVNHWHRTQV